MSNPVKTVSLNTLTACIQAIDSEMERLRSLPQNEILAEEEIQYVDYQTAATELEKIYALWNKELTNLTPYSQLTPYAHRDVKV